MGSQEQKLADMQEHLFYELLMLRYTGHRLQHVDGLLWNALYESFSVHARALYEFLKNDKDTRNYRAREYVNEFDCDTTSMQALMDRMQQQVMHLGKRRTVDKGEIDINGIKQM